MGGRASTSARGRSAVLPEGSEVGGRVSLTGFSVTGALQGTIDSVANNTNLALRRLRADGDAAAVAVASVKQLPGGGYVLEDSNGNQKRLSDDTVNWFKRRNGDALSGSRAFVPWIVQQAYFEKGLDDVVIHRGSGAVVFSDASGFTALTERLAQKSNGAELLSQCLTAFFTPLINLITDYRGDVIKFSGDALMIYYPATDDLDGPQKKYKVPPHGSFGLPDLGPMATAVLRACACCIEIQKRLHNFETGVDGVRLCLHIGVGCGDVAILQVGGVEPPETHVPRSEYIVAGPPLEQVAIAEPLAKNGETCVSPQAWEHVQNCVIEDRRRTLELNPDYHLLLKLDESRYTFPTIKFSAKERDRRHEKQFQLSELDFIRRYIPSAVFKQIEGGTLTYVNEMRRVSTIFVNVSGLDVSTDAGALIAQDLTSSIQRACYVNEGTLNKFVLDDKGLLFLLVYGLPPLVHTDDPTRAVLTCFEIVKIFKRLSLVGRCGVTTGRVYCGVCGSAERMEYTVLGDDVNLSARLMANAPAGGILVDSPTATECTDELGFEALPCILVKGKSSEIPIFRPERKFPTWHVGVGPGGNLVFPWYVRPGTSAKRGSGCTEASVTELKQNVRHLCSLGGWSGIEKVQNMLGGTFSTELHSGPSVVPSEANKGPRVGSEPPSESPFRKGGLVVLNGPAGVGKVELSEHAVLYAATYLNIAPIFGTMGPRVQDIPRLGVELLRSTLGVFRHLVDPSLPKDDLEALDVLLDKLSTERKALLQEAFQDLEEPENGPEVLVELVNLAVVLIEKLKQHTAVMIVLQLEYGTSLFPKTLKYFNCFWDVVTKLAPLATPAPTAPEPKTTAMQSLMANSSTAQIPPRDQSKPAVMWILCRNFDKTNVAVKAATARGNLFELSGLSQETCTEYMAMHLNVPLNIFPLKLVSFVAKLSLGNPMYLRETFHNLIREGHVTIELDADTKEACKVVCCEDLEGINIVGWAHTAMVGETVCLLESLDPLESATLKMTTVFSKSFTLPDLAASICSRWAGSTRFDTLRLFRAVQNLTLRGIIIPQAQPRKHLDVQPDSKDTKVTDSTRELQRYEMNNVLIRKVGGAMLLEAQKKVVKRQALIDRALARDLPARMEEVQLKKLEPHIPWYYENILTRG